MNKCSTILELNQITINLKLDVLFGSSIIFDFHDKQIFKEENQINNKSTHLIKI